MPDAAGANKASPGDGGVKICPATGSLLGVCRANTKSAAHTAVCRIAGSVYTLPKALAWYVTNDMHMNRALSMVQPLSTGPDLAGGRPGAYPGA